MAAVTPLTLHWHIGDVVVKLRSIRKMNAKELAQRAGVKGNTISALENGTGRSQAKTVKKVARVLGVSVEDIFSLVPAPTHTPDTLLPKSSISVEKSAPQQPSSESVRKSQEESQALNVPSSSNIGQNRTVQREENQAEAVKALRQAAKEFKIAAKFARTVSAKEVAKAGRQAAKARLALARKREGTRKNR